MSILKKIILALLKIPSNIYNRLLLTYRNVSFKKFPNINGFILLKGHGKLKIGKNLSINSGVNYNPIGGDKKMILIIKKNAFLTIRNNVGISNSAIICHERIEIEDNVKLGGGVKIYDTDFHSLDYKNRRAKATDIGRTKPVLIKKDAFIGAHSIILKGVTIGEKSIIGAGSVVAKNIPDGEIWAGNPAKFIKKI